MQLRSLPQRDLVETAKKYQSQYSGSPAEAYITARGLGSVAEKFGLGYVGSARTGDERYLGYLAIPFLRPAGGSQRVITVRYRCIADACVKDSTGSYLGHRENHQNHGKYEGYPGVPTHLFNTAALISPSPYVAVVEGELDPMAAAVADVPAVGVTGVSGWKDHYTAAFAGYEAVFAIEDGDEAGRKFTAKLTEQLARTKVVPISLGDHYDTNRFIQEYGPDAFRERLGL